MRPRDREQEAVPPEPSPPPAPARPGGGLSSMVVKPSDSGAGGGDEAGLVPSVNDCRVDSPPPTSRRRRSPPDLRRRGGSPPAFRRRGDSPPPLFHRRGTPPDFRRRGTPPDLRPRYSRFHDEPGYGMHAGSVSPRHRPRLVDGHYNSDFDGSVGPRSGRGFRGGRGGGRFRGASPHNGLGRGGGRSYGRGYNLSGRGLPSFEGEYVHRNDPNLSPREGDWICRNPTCGNLNFARRTHCNNCNKYRYGPELHRSSRSPRRGYLNSPPPHVSPLRMLDLPIDRGLRRDIDRYRSPSRGWDVDDPRSFGPASSPLARGGRFADVMRRADYHDELEYRERGKFDWPAPEEWDRRDRGRDGFFLDRREYDRRPQSPRGRWVRDLRDRSRSPIGDRPLKASYLGRGRADRRYDDSYIGRGRADDMDAGRGRGYRRAGDTFARQGRGDRRGMARGGSNDIY